MLVQDKKWLNNSISICRTNGHQWTTTPSDGNGRPVGSQYVGVWTRHRRHRAGRAPRTGGDMPLRFSAVLQDLFRGDLLSGLRRIPYQNGEADAVHHPHGQRFALAMPRGSGKSALCDAAGWLAYVAAIKDRRLADGCDETA